MRIGLVCPYSWDIPGGVQAHVRDLAETFIAQGHSVSVLAPGDDDEPGLPAYVVTSGKAVPFPYNGSIARVQFGLVSAARVRRWLRDGGFDVVHVHEPAAASLSLLACMMHDGPLVATFHMALTHSRFLAMFDNVLQPFLEKISGRIAVSAAARKVIVEHLGGDAVVIPNGVAVARYAGAQPLPGYPREGATIGFIGRYDEARKGMDVLTAALAELIERRPGLRLVVAGRGEADEFRVGLPSEVSARIDLLGQVSEDDKARMLRSVDIYCAPNTGQESFGIILLEALAAGTPIVASDLDAFKQVLRRGEVGRLFPVGDPHQLALAIEELLDDPPLRASLAAAGAAAVAPFDWTVIAAQVMRVYEVAVSGTSVVSPVASVERSEQRLR
jgi:phosphatidylinositol alpha-mannosyltransferase